MNLAGLFSGSGGAFEPPRSLYIHIPFCSSRCAYCDFHSFPCARTSPAERSAYVRTLPDRAKTLCEALGASIETIYVGGGTPTILDDADFGGLLSGLAGLFGAGIREWTVEANPESLSPAKMDMMVSRGVTRLSVGIQSMDDGELEILGREARSRDNRRALDLAAGSGLALSADLIAGIPRPGAAGGTRDSGRYGIAAGPSALAESVEFLAGSGVGHISIYDLVVEEGTIIQKRLEGGTLSPADEELSFGERVEAEAFLRARGYRRYEVSNYALPGRECLHNKAYWSMNSYLGIGSGAVSTLNLARGSDSLPLAAAGAMALRIEEGKDLPRYLLDADEAAGLSWINRKDSAFEMVMMSLRCADGLDEARFLKRFGLDAKEVLAATVGKWKGRFAEGGGRLKLDGAGLDILNRILVDAMTEMEPYFADKRETGS